MLAIKQSLKQTAGGHMQVRKHGRNKEYIQRGPHLFHLLDLNNRCLTLFDPETFLISKKIFHIPQIRGKKTKRKHVFPVIEQVPLTLSKSQIFATESINTY